MANNNARSPKRTMNVLFACDNGIAKYVPVLIISIMENHPEENVAFYLMHSSISAENLGFIRDTVRKYKNGSLYEIVPPESYVDCFKDVGARYRMRWPKECFYYLLAHTLLPAALERILYLDVDIIVNGDMRPFYYSDFEGKPITVVELRSLEQVARLRLNPSYDVGFIASERFNSGVVLMNLVYFRNHINRGFYDKLVASYRARGVLQSLFADQGVANAAFHMDAKYADKRYHGIHEVNENTVIYHAGGHPNKPWAVRHDGASQWTAHLGAQKGEAQMNRIWWKYAEMSPNYDRLRPVARAMKPEVLARFTPPKNILRQRAAMAKNTQPKNPASRWANWPVWDGRTMR